MRIESVYFPIIGDYDFHFHQFGVIIYNVQYGKEIHSVGNYY
jgi:hypothetical protein